MMNQLEQKFNFVTNEIYSVPDNAQDFPALTSMNVNQGISSVKYSINPARLTNFNVNDSIEEIIKQ